MRSPHSVLHLGSDDGYTEVTVSDHTMDYFLSSVRRPPDLSLGGWLCMAPRSAKATGHCKANTLTTRGDVFRIAVVDGQVQYSKNGTVFYISPAPMATSQYPLAAFASLWSFGATVGNAQLSATFALAPTRTPMLRPLSTPVIFRSPVN